MPYLVTFSVNAGAEFVAGYFRARPPFLDVLLPSGERPLLDVRCERIENSWSFRLVPSDPSFRLTPDGPALPGVVLAEAQVRPLATDRAEVQLVGCPWVTEKSWLSLLGSLRTAYPEAGEQLGPPAPAEVRPAAPTAPAEPEAKRPRIPSRAPERRRWVEVWRAAQPLWRKRSSYDDICKFLGDKHPGLYVSVETLAKIMRAGEAGELSP